METLDKALSRVWQSEWMRMRSGPTLRSQAEKAVYSVMLIATDRSGPHQHQYAGVTANDVTPAHIQQVTADWYAAGLSPATITKRLNCLSKLGVNVEGCRVKVPKQLKWHLKESDKPKVLEFLDLYADSEVTDMYRLTAIFVEWTTLTGLRIEESLRLRKSDFSGDFSQVSVPGLKTSSSQATLPLSSRATEIVLEELGRSPITDQPLFPISYGDLGDIWQGVRIQFGWASDPTATLKALRRSAARYLHIDCGMPLHMVQQYLRHESMDTTLEYLRLTGGYGTEEMRRYLK